MILIGFGVVVTTTRGSGPSRSPNISMSHASGYRQEAISSHHAASCCGPRRRSGSSAHYSGQNGNYPVYLCRADQHQHGGPRCQEVRALGVDAAVERLLLEALTPDRLALAIAARGELENEARALERQWSLKRERARYEAERA